MAYVTTQDLIARLGPREATAISDRQGTGMPDLVELQRLLTEAESVVNGYVGRRYLVPLSIGGVAAAAPDALKVALIDVARYNATGTEIMVTEAIRDRYRDAIRYLEQLAEGKVRLVGQFDLVGAGGPAPVGGAFAVRTRPPVIDHSGML